MMKYTKLLALTLLLNGCATTPTNNIAEFGLAINNVSQQISHDLSELEAIAIQSQADALAYLTLDHSKENLCQGSASQAINGEFNDDISSCNLPLRLDDLKTIINPNSPALRQQMLIVESNRQLAIYAQALTELASVADAKAIQQNSLHLTTSIGELSDAYLQLHYRNTPQKEPIILRKEQAFDDQQAQIATAIAAFATAITEEKRRIALKQVINHGEQVIAVLIPLIIKELENAQLHQSIAMLERSALIDDIIQYNQASIKRPLKHDKAAKSVLEFYQRYQQIQIAALKDQQLITTFKQIAISHQQVAEQVNQDRFSSKETISAISELNRKYQDLNRFEQLITRCQGKVITDENGFLICQD